LLPLSDCEEAKALAGRGSGFGPRLGTDAQALLNSNRRSAAGRAIRPAEMLLIIRSPKCSSKLNRTVYLYARSVQPVKHNCTVRYRIEISQFLGL
jgi:hypothetical protein